MNQQEIDREKREAADRARANEEWWQINRHNDLNNRLTELKRQLVELHLKVESGFGIDINVNQVIPQNGDNQFSQAAIQVLGNQALQSFVRRNALSTSSNLAYLPHEISQTVEIRSSVRQSIELLYNVNSFFSSIKRHKAAFGIDISDFVEEQQYQEMDVFSRYFSIHSESGDYNQEDQNRLLTDIEDSLKRVAVIFSNVKQTFGKAIHTAISNGNLGQIRRCLTIADLNTKVNGANILEHALCVHQPAVLQNILRFCGKDVFTTRFSDGELPIIYAVEESNNLLLGHILVAEVNPNTVFEAPQISKSFMIWFLSIFYTIGATPLHLAIELYSNQQGATQEQFDIILRLLTNSDARVNIPDNNGITAYQMLSDYPTLKGRIADHLPDKFKGIDSENYVAKSVHNIYFQYGIITGKLFIAPAINCADKQIKYLYGTQEFYQCYAETFNQDNIISALKYPAISLALQYYVAPAYTMLVIAGFDLYQSGSSTVWDVLNIMSGFAVNAVASYYIGQQPIYQDHPFLVGVLVTSSVPAVHFAKDIMFESYDKLYCNIVGCNSDDTHAEL